jgi:hypothetical protein
MTQIAHPDPVQEMARFLAAAPPREQIAQFALSESARAYAIDLLEASKEGRTTPDQEAELDRITLLGDFMNLVQIMAEEGPTPDAAGADRDDYAAFFARGPSRDEILHFAPSQSRIKRIDQLYTRVQAGEATPEEWAEWDFEAALNDFCARIRGLAGQGTAASDHPSGVSITPGR